MKAINYLAASAQYATLGDDTLCFHNHDGKSCNLVEPGIINLIQNDNYRCIRQILSWSRNNYQLDFWVLLALYPIKSLQSRQCNNVFFNNSL